jgi:chromosome segregation ATPase
MEQEQILKRLEWLDEERRRDKTQIATLQERITQLESQISPLNQQIGNVESDVTRLTSTYSRFDQVDTTIAQIKVDYSRAIDTIEKQRIEREREGEKQHRLEHESLVKSISEVRKALEPIGELKKGLQARVEGEYRLGRLIEEVDKKIDENVRSNEEYRRSIKLLDDSRRQDAKRLTDVQSEIGALRKRIDEQRGKMDLSLDSVRKLELRLGEIQAAETERRQAQVGFIEKQNMVSVERERLWKDWQTRFETIVRQSSELESQVQNLDDTHRSVKRAQEAFEEITQRFERRMNELTEMQRLSEERFRQEWVTFKADDQKRWTNFNLGQEESQRETNRLFEKYTDRLVLIEDGTQEMRDNLDQLVEDSQRALRGLLALLNETVDGFDRVFGSPR